MISFLASNAASPAPHAARGAAGSGALSWSPAGGPARPAAGARIADTLALVGARLAPQRRVVRAGDRICAAGERFDHLFLLNAGICKVVNLAADGREQVVGLKFRGDWLGFDGIAEGRYACDAIAMDTGEVWAVRYDALLAASLEEPRLLRLLHEAMSREISRDRDSMLSVCTLPAEARVAEFLHGWTGSLAERGLRTDEITLRMTRAEIGNYLGMTLETVSRSLSRLARNGLIDFTGRSRRDIRIPDVAALADFVQRGGAPVTAMLQ